MSDAGNAGVNAMDVAVVGVGRMGRHHARTYAGLPGVRLAAVVDGDRARAEAVAGEFGGKSYTRVEAMLDRQPHLAAATVAVPTIHHPAVAVALLERGISCLVEKPLAAGVEEGRSILAAAQRGQAVLQVGHTERFNPAVRALLAMQLVPRYIEVSRVSPMTFRSLDVGAVMDMMIHDLDIVLTLADSPLARVDATGVSVISPREDIASARLVFENGCVAALSVSRLSLKTDRRLRVFSESGFVSIDYAARSGVVISKTDHAQALDRCRQALARGEDLSSTDYRQLVKLRPLTIDLPPGQEDPLTGELSAFLESVRTRSRPVVDGPAGLRAIETADRIVAAIRNHRWAGLGQSPV